MVAVAAKFPPQTAHTSDQSGLPGAANLGGRVTHARHFLHLRPRQFSQDTASAVSQPRLDRQHLLPCRLRVSGDEHGGLLACGQKLPGAGQ